MAQAKVKAKAKAEVRVKVKAKANPGTGRGGKACVFLSRALRAPEACFLLINKFKIRHPTGPI